MRIDEEIDNNSDILIECRDVHKSFGEKQILKGVSFKVSSMFFNYACENDSCIASAFFSSQKSLSQSDFMLAYDHLCNSVNP